jgi:hypothetical protein
MQHIQNNRAHFTCDAVQLPESVNASSHSCIHYEQRYNDEQAQPLQSLPLRGQMPARLWLSTTHL